LRSASRRSCAVAQTRSMAREAVPARRDRAVVVAATLLLVGYAAVAGQFQTFTRQAQVATFIPGLVAVVVAWRVPARTHARPDRRRIGWLCWWLVAAGVLVLEIVSLVAGADHDHPTISDLVNPWLAGAPGRTVAFGLWLALGCWLVGR
jgi:hypothetical protein